MSIPSAKDIKDFQPGEIIRSYHPTLEGSFVLMAPTLTKEGFTYCYLQKFGASESQILVYKLAGIYLQRFSRVPSKQLAYISSEPFS